MSEIKQYDTEVRLEAVMGTNHYGVHIHAMTTEDLHSKSDIAVELAWRDLRIEQLVSENTALTDKAASELSNAWLLHKYWVGIQVALMYIRAGNINDATEWLVGTVSGPGIEAPDLIFTAEIESWAEIQQKDIISHAKAVEIIKAEMSATTQALNEYIARSIVAPDGYQLCFVPLEQTTAFRDACTTAYEESLSGTGPCGIFMAGYRSMLAAAPKIAASLRGEQNV